MKRAPRVRGPDAPDGERLPKRRRLLKRAEFLRVQKQNVREHGRLFVMLAQRRDPPDGGPRLGIVASRKVGPSVARNRAKRLVREWYRRATIEAPVDLVVILKAGAGDAVYSDLCAELDRALGRVLRASVRGARAVGG